MSPACVVVADRCAPTFVLIGTPKSGTTSLYAYLLQHHLVRGPRQKELRVFSPTIAPKAGANLTLEQYVKLFPRIRPEDSPIILGEASPAYFYHPAAATFFSSNANVRLVLLLRHPVSRWLSEFHQRRTPPIHPNWMMAETFAGLVGHAHKALHGKTGCARIFTVCFSGTARRRQCCLSPVTTNSWYDLFLPRWRRTVEQQRLHITFTEDVSRDAQSELRKLTAFLDLPAHVYNTTVVLNHHRHYDHSGQAKNAVASGAAASDVLCDSPKVLARAHALMLPGVKGLARQLRPLGLAPPTAWWSPPICSRPSRLAVMIAGHIRSFVVPSVWRSIGQAVNGLCADGQSALKLFLCPSEAPVGGVAERLWLAASVGLADMLRPHCLGGVCSADTQAESSEQLESRETRCSGNTTTDRWPGALARWRCHRKVVAAERALGYMFDWVVVMRFDVGYFGKLPSLSSLPSGVTIPANHGQNFGESRTHGWMSDHFAVASRYYSTLYCYHPCQAVEHIVQHGGSAATRAAAEEALEAHLSATKTPVHLRYVPWVLVRALDDNAGALYAAECWRHIPCCVRPTSKGMSELDSGKGLVGLLRSSSARSASACRHVISRGSESGSCPTDRSQRCERHFQHDLSVVSCHSLHKCSLLIRRHTELTCNHTSLLVASSSHDQRLAAVKECTARYPNWARLTRRDWLGDVLASANVTVDSSIQHALPQRPQAPKGELSARALPRQQIRLQAAMPRTHGDAAQNGLQPAWPQRP